MAELLGDEYSQVPARGEVDFPKWKLPLLSKEKRRWQIGFDGVALVICYGQNKIQTSSRVVRTNKSNRTLQEQAMLEASADYSKKIDAGYAEEGVESLVVEPMAGKDFSEHSALVKYPCWGSTKLDGVRCLARMEGGKAVLVSRKNKQYTSVPEVRREAEVLLAELPEGCILDGELYIHGVPLSTINGLANRNQSDAETAALGYCVFDCVLPIPFDERISALRAACAIPELSKVHLEDSELLHSIEEVTRKYHEKIAEGYEGLMIRQSILANPGGEYTKYAHGRKVGHLLKLKAYGDDEGVVTDVIETPNEPGLAMLVVRDDLSDYSLSLRFGREEERAEWLLNKEIVVGRVMTYQYTFRHPETKIPQVCTAKAWRDAL